jgi:hypothetical protein
MVGSVLQGLIVLNNLDTYIYQSWHGTLLTIAVIVFASLFNTLLAVRLPMIEGVLLILHLAGLFAIIIPLWVMAPRGNVKDTILTFTTTAGWSDVSLASLIGMVSVIAVLVGYDCTVHMCEYAVMKLHCGTSLTSNHSRRSTRRLNRIAPSLDVVHLSQRHHGNSHGRDFRLLHRRHRQRSRQPHERAFYPGLLQRNPKLCWGDYHDNDHCRYAHISLYQRSRHGFETALVVCARQWSSMLEMALPCSGQLEHSTKCRVGLGCYQHLAEHDQHRIVRRAQCHQFTRCCELAVQLHGDYQVRRLHYCQNFYILVADSICPHSCLIYRRTLTAQSATAPSPSFPVY